MVREIEGDEEICGMSTENVVFLESIRNFIRRKRKERGIGLRTFALAWARGKRGLLAIRRNSRGARRWVFTSSTQTEKGLFAAIYQALVGGTYPPGMVWGWSGSNTVQGSHFGQTS